MIKFDNVVKRLGGRAVLDGASFEVRDGEILALVGPSGTGKSVTLRHIVGLLAPTSGRVEVDGIDVGGAGERELEAVRSRVGYLFQGGALLGWLSVAENVALPLRERGGLSEAEIGHRVADALAAVELSDAAERYPSEISGGMLKRAGLARAVVRDVGTVLYDEPTSGLDPVTASVIDSLIQRLNRERGITSVVVTHDLVSALEWADRIVMLSGGRAVASGTPAEFLASQAPEVREFLRAQRIAANIGAPSH